MNRAMFDTRLLSGVGALSAVVKAGNFLRAAQSMGLTQPAVSRAASRLEQRVGIRLFHRTSRSVTLTDEGRRFYEAVAPLLAGIEAAALDARSTMAEVHGLLRISVDRIFAEYVLAPSLQPFLAAHPGLTVEIVVQERFGDLVSEGFDLAIHSGDPRPTSLRCDRLMDVAVVTCASPAYLERRGAPKEPGDIERDHDCVLMRNPATGRPFDWEFIRGEEIEKISASGRLVVTDAGSLIGACLGGLGIGQPLDIYARQHLADGRLVKILPDWSDETFPVHIYRHEPKFSPERVKVFLRHLDEVVAAHDGRAPTSAVAAVSAAPAIAAAVSVARATRAAMAVSRS